MVTFFVTIGMELVKEGSVVILDGVLLSTHVNTVALIIMYLCCCRAD
jgi:hypothetical protein